MSNKLNGSSESNKAYGSPERRKYSRFEFNFSLKYTKLIREIREQRPDLIVFREEGKYEPAKSVNLSLDGACFIAPANLLPNTLLSLEVFSPLQRETFRILARVVWNELAFLQDYRTGVQFISIDKPEGFRSAFLLHQKVDMKPNDESAGEVEKKD